MFCFGISYECRHVYSLMTNFCLFFSNFDFIFKILGGDSKLGGFKVFATFRPEHSLNPYEPGKRPVKLPGAVGMCPADNFAHIGKMAAAADICLFHIADHEEANRLLEDTIRAIQVTDSVARRGRVAKTLVLVSTAMTWARTKECGRSSYPPLLGLSDAASGPDRERLGFCEEEFRRRKAHPNFRRHLEVERNFLRIGEPKNVSCESKHSPVYGRGGTMFFFTEKFCKGMH